MAKTARNRRDRQKAEIRADLVAAAHALVREDGYEGLTIRRLAERVGYAPMSVYSYFPDKHAILFALAQDAFEILAHRMERDTPDEPMAALRKLMHDYADFAFENPNEYRTVFMSRDSEMGAPEGVDLHTQNPALNLLLARVQACVDAGLIKGNTFAIATMLWTCGHGAVSLLISFPRYPFGDVRTFVDGVIDVALAGVGATSPESPDGSAAC